MQMIALIINIDNHVRVTEWFSPPPLKQCLAGPHPRRRRAQLRLLFCLEKRVPAYKATIKYWTYLRFTSICIAGQNEIARLPVPTNVCNHTVIPITAAS